jgi:hypothetical protein
MASVLFLRKKIPDDFNILNLSIIAMFSMTVFLSSLAGRNFIHYYMVFLPCLVLPIA